MRTVRFDYASSADGTCPLYATAAFDPAVKKSPLLVVMHGWSETVENVLPDAKRLAEQGLFTLAVEMRGRGGSAGSMDSGGVEIHDIYDAVQHCLREYPEYIDDQNLNIVGYSGGGGNVFSALTKFPDMFSCGVSFFGVSDYTNVFTESMFTGTDLRAELFQKVGGTPEEVPGNYDARKSFLGAINNPYTKTMLFWDEEEPACPAYHNTIYKMISDILGYENVSLHESKRVDEHRWIHGYPSGRPGLIEAEKYFVPAILKKEYSSPMLSRSGRMVILGYLVTKEFRVWLGDGQNAVAGLSYALSGREKTFKFNPVSGGPETTLGLNVRISDMTFPISVHRNGEFLEKLPSGSDYHAEIRARDTVTLSSSG